MLNDYNHARWMVSELGTIGTPSQYFFTAGLVLSAILSVLFIIGLIRACKLIGISNIPVILIFTFSFSIAGAALFPLPLQLHGILGSPSMVLPLSPILALILWPKANIPGMKLFAIFSFLIMALGFSVMIPDFFDEYFGIKQRAFHLGWTIWFVYLSVAFINYIKSRESKKILFNKY